MGVERRVVPHGVHPQLDVCDKFADVFYGRGFCIHEVGCSCSYLLTRLTTVDKPIRYPHCGVLWQRQVRVFWERIAQHFCAAVRAGGKAPKTAWVLGFQEYWQRV